MVRRSSGARHEGEGGPERDEGVGGEGVGGEEEVSYLWCKIKPWEYLRVVKSKRA